MDAQTDRRTDGRLSHTDRLVSAYHVALQVQKLLCVATEGLMRTSPAGSRGGRGTGRRAFPAQQLIPWRCRPREPAAEDVLA
eukprot:scaffold222472_cov35-Prasinocladus_malaysianus.AAC.1